MPNKRKVALKEKSGLRGKAAIALLPKDAEPHYIIALANAPNSV